MVSSDAKSNLHLFSHFFYPIPKAWEVKFFSLLSKYSNEANKVPGIFSPKVPKHFFALTSKTQTQTDNDEESFEE